MAMHEAAWLVDGDEVVDGGRSTCAAGDDRRTSRRRHALAWLAVAGMAASAVSPWVERVRVALGDRRARR